MCVKLYHYIRECLDTPRRIVVLGDFLKEYHFDSAQCTTPNEFDDLLFEIASHWSRDPHKVYTVRLIPPFDFSLSLFEVIQSKISLIYFMPDSDSVMKANFVGKQPVIFPHEIPKDVDDFKSIIRAARDMRAKYSIPANTLEYEGDRYRLMDFFADYCQFSSARGFITPIDEIKAAYRNYLMSIERYTPYVSTKSFMRYHFNPELEGYVEMLSEIYNRRVSIKRSMVCGKHALRGIRLNCKGHLFLV